MAITPISTRTIDNIKRKSVNYLPNKASQFGFSPESIKSALVDLITGADNSVIAELTRIITEANGAFVEVSNLGEGVATLVDGKVPEAQLPDKALNVQANWTETVTTVDSFIKNKPHIPTVSDYIPQTDKGVGVATLENGKVPASQMPGYADDTIEGVLTDGQFLVDGVAITPESGKLYVDTNTNLGYRWSGSMFVEISPGLALGETSSTAFAGNRGKAVEDRIGTGTLNTTAQELIGAINEILTSGVLISTIGKTTSGLVDTYTITFNDSSTYQFTVTNGAQGIQGIQGEQGIIEIDWRVE